MITDVSRILFPQPTRRPPSVVYCGSVRTRRLWSSNPSTRPWLTERSCYRPCCPTRRWVTYSRAWSCSRELARDWLGTTSRWQCHRTIKCALRISWWCCCSTQSCICLSPSTWKRLFQETVVSTLRGTSRSWWEPIEANNVLLWWKTNQNNRNNVNTQINVFYFILCSLVPSPQTRSSFSARSTRHIDI